jgi:guanylate kinase
MIIIMGKGGAGKDTVSKLLKNVYGIPRVVTYTTRKMRPGERDGVEYHFISECEFLEKEAAGFFAETSKTGKNRYGSPASAFSERNAHIILDPEGVRQAVRKTDPSNVIIFLLDAEENILRERMLKRGDQPEKVEDRLKEDRIRFENLDSICSGIISIYQNDMTSADEIALYISNFA